MNSNLNRHQPKLTPKPKTSHPPHPSFRFSKPVRQLLLSTVILTLGLGTLPVQAQISDPQVGALVEALRLAAPQTGTENDGLYSDWQIKPDNIPRWSKQCTGRELTPADFEASPVTARAILVCVMGDVLREQYSASGNNEAIAVQRTAAWWMTGDANQYNRVPTNSYTHSYIQKVLNFYQQQRRTSQSQNPTTPPPSEPSPTLARSSSNSAISDRQISALVEALRLAAPQTGVENDNLYSDWQIKPDNIPRWSNQCIGRELTPADFEASPVTARAILVCVMRDVFSEQYTESENNESLAVQRAAAWWMTGDGNQYNNSSTASYTQRVLDLYRQSFLKFFPHI